MLPILLGINSESIWEFVPCLFMRKQDVSYEQLWERVLRDDMQALEKIYKNAYSELFRYAQKLTHNPLIAQDAIQDTFLYLWQHRNEIGSIKSVKFYLIRSIRNACLLAIKKNNKLQSLEGVANNLTIEPEDLHLITGEEKLKIKRSLSELSPRQREIIFLKFYNNLDYEEISEILDINYQSVVNHVYKAIQKLRKSETLQYFRSFNT